MRDNCQSKPNGETEEDEFDSIDILSIYRLSRDEIAIVDRFAELIDSVATSHSCNHAHLAAIIKYTSNKIFETRNNLGTQKDEIENQKSDLEHKLSFTYPNTEEYNDTLKAIGNTILERRIKKDTWTILSVISTNLNKSGNFILGMTKRAYTPRSNKYKEDGCMVNNNYNTTNRKNNPTTMKFNDMKK